MTDVVNIGAVAGNGLGDTLREGGRKINEAFDVLNLSIIPNSRLADMPEFTVKGALVPGAPTDLTMTQLAGALGIDRTLDANKPVSTAAQTALNLKQNLLGYTPENAALKGVANGYAGLGADGRVPPEQLPVSGSYVGVWNASTNSPTITSSVGTAGAFYIVSVAGTTNINGTASWSVGDQIRFNGSIWQRVPASTTVSSVAGRTGVVTLTTADIGGLGNSATRNVGTTTGTVAAGDDARLSDQRVPTDGSVTAAKMAAGAAATNLGATAAQLRDRTTHTGTQAISTIANLQASLDAKLDATHVGTGGAAHANATTVNAGFMSATDKIKLDSIDNTPGSITDVELSDSLAAVLTGRAATRTALKALSTTRFTSIYLTEAGREGLFVWRSGDYSAKITLDPGEGIYIKANAVAASLGAWVRSYNGPIKDTWFGCVPNQLTDSLTACQNAINVHLTDGGEIEWSKGFYLLSAPLTISFAGGSNYLRMRGQGTVGGTVFKVLAGSFSGTSLMKVTGLAGADKTYDFRMEHFALINDTGGPSIGLEFDGPSNSSAAAYKEAVCQDLLIANFVTDCSIRNWRQINFVRVGCWSETVANATGFLVTVGAGTSAFCGDHTFEKCQVTLGGSGTSFGWNIYSNGTNAISIAGIRITNPIVYKATHKVYVNCNAATSINDIWVTDGQLDGPAGNGITLDANVSGGSINNVHYEGNYHTANSGQIARLINSNGGKIREVFVNRNRAIGGTSVQILLESGTGGAANRIMAVSIKDNKFRDISVGSGGLTDTCIFVNAGDNITIEGNQLHRENAAFLDSFILFGAGTNLLASNNNSGSYVGATGWTGCVVNLVAFTGSNNI